MMLGAFIEVSLIKIIIELPNPLVESDVLRIYCWDRLWTYGLVSLETKVENERTPDGQIDTKVEDDHAFDF